MGLPFQEDMWTPGLFELSLEPGVTSYLVVSVGALPTEPPEELMGRAVEFLAGCDPGSDRPPAERVLCIAAEQFRADVCPRPATIAGYPLLDVRARDMVLSLPGLYLVQNRMPEAERVFATLRSLLRGGLLSDTLDQAGAKRRAPMPDATLWLFEAVREFDKRVPPDYPMLQKVLYPMLRRAFVRIRSKQKRTIWLTADGLIANYDEHRALTWMDAHLGARLVTPRRGLAVEFQALWSRGCETLAALGHRYGDRVTAMAAERACDAARIAFRDRFWCNETDYPFDTLSEVRDSADAWADPTVRPNALIALAVDPELFEAWQASAILERVRRELLTPHGIRSLTPRDERYIGQFGGSSDEHEVAYHQGTAWPHLLGFYARASARLTDRDSAVLEDLRQRVSALANGGLTLGSVGQIASGDAPHRWRGSPAYAMAVGELLRALIEDLA
jgi:predicted glycogen debranching enzyme